MAAKSVYEEVPQPSEPAARKIPSFNSARASSSIIRNCWLLAVMAASVGVAAVVSVTQNSAPRNVTWARSQSGSGTTPKAKLA